MAVWVSRRTHATRRKLQHDKPRACFIQCCCCVCARNEWTKYCTLVNSTITHTRSVVDIAYWPKEVVEEIERWECIKCVIVGGEYAKKIIIRTHAGCMRSHMMCTYGFGLWNREVHKTKQKPNYIKINFVTVFNLNYNHLNISCYVLLTVQELLYLVIHFWKSVRKYKYNFGYFIYAMIIDRLLPKVIAWCCMYYLLLCMEISSICFTLTIGRNSEFNVCMNNLIEKLNQHKCKFKL